MLCSQDVPHVLVIGIAATLVLGLAAGLALTTYVQALKPLVDQDGERHLVCKTSWQQPVTLMR